MIVLYSCTFTMFLAPANCPSIENQIGRQYQRDRNLVSPSPSDRLDQKYPRRLRTVISYIGLPPPLSSRGQLLVKHSQSHIYLLHATATLVIEIT